jgi:GDP-L-fucose synthase
MQLPKAVFEQYTHPMQSHINVGSGAEVTIGELAQHIAKTVGYTGQITFDTSKPDGAPRKRIDSSRVNALGWNPMIDLEKGLAIAYQDFVSNY